MMFSVGFTRRSSCKLVLLVFCVFVPSFEYCSARAQEQTPGCNLTTTVCTSQSDCPPLHFCHKAFGICQPCEEICCDKLMASPGTCRSECGAFEDYRFCRNLRAPKPSQQCKNDTLAANTCALVNQTLLVAEIIKTSMKRCTARFVPGGHIDCKFERYSELTEACTKLNGDICRITSTIALGGSMYMYVCSPKSCESMLEALFAIPGATVDVDCDFESGLAGWAIAVIVIAVVTTISLAGFAFYKFSQQRSA